MTTSQPAAVWAVGRWRESKIINELSWDYVLGVREELRDDALAYGRTLTSPAADEKLELGAYLHSTGEASEPCGSCSGNKSADAGG